MSAELRRRLVGEAQSKLARLASRDFSYSDQHRATLQEMLKLSESLPEPESAEKRRSAALRADRIGEIIGDHVPDHRNIMRNGLTPLGYQDRDHNWHEWPPGVDRDALRPYVQEQFRSDADEDMRLRQERNAADDALYAAERLLAAGDIEGAQEVIERARLSTY